MSATAPLPPLRPGVTLRPDQVFSRAGGQDRLADLYLPAGAGPHPAVIFLHGGGWRFGDRRLAPDLSRHFAEAGYVMVSIDYRLSGEAGFPAAVEDVVSAICWLRATAAQHGVDPDRIALMGSSAGGHLACLAALAPETFRGGDCLPVGAQVAAVIDGYGPVDFTRIDAQRDPDALPGTDPESAHLPPPRPMSDPGALECLFLGGVVADIPDRARAASPLSHVSAAAPPMLIAHGTFDGAIPPAQSAQLFEALDRAGARAEWLQIEGLGHGFLNRSALDEAGPFAMTRRLSRAAGGTGAAIAERSGVWQAIRSFLDRTLPGPAR
ncbi:alpha/beta hydrolase [Mangrovicoccus algicola]|uniref:Alpha/beta hydrolase n=1 Tax=Mangrovicoccus algicola TaxID=2771008 RepID=A0A8J7CME0_9RHOB|nr:alpha/beta hydrolase [Mangrovicoccus algicola]MBE3640291.1 alpha/beta hydrolase [Mangrovicoccus algicola]